MLTGILLIVLGIAFGLRQAGLLPFDMSLLWPLLLIAVGIRIMLRPAGMCCERLGRGERLPAQALASAARSEPGHVERIPVRDGAKAHVVPVETIDFVQAQDDYVSFKCGDREYLKEQSFVLNRYRLVRVELDERENRVAVLSYGRRLPISRSGYARLAPLLRL